MAKVNDVLQPIDKRPNKLLHPTASVPFVPHFTAAAGELGRSIDRPYLAGLETDCFWGLKE